MDNQNLEYISARLEKMRRKLSNLMNKKDYENALLLISCMAEILYKYNQSYTDWDLEDKLRTIQQNINPAVKKHHAMPLSCKTIMFYDGFGLDLRGLAFIYLSALAKMKYRLVYIVRNKRRDKIPTITSLLKEHGAKIIYIPRLSLTDEYRYLEKITDELKPSAGFLYTTPNDVSGIMAFMAGKNKYIRYQINLTDHAFWLGCNAFDFSIEFRDYGASVSHYYRNIPKEKIIKLPYYPYIDKSKDFEGYPFPVSENDLIIFSGGSLYKTFDGKENLYYKIIDFCLHNYEQVKFWYAGSGDDSELVKLMKKYPNRVFHTDERNDLFQIMLNIDLYISTYPMGGGLMSQYSAIAGVVPLALRSGDETGGILNSDIVSYEFDNLEDFKYELQHLLSDKAYRINQGKKLKESIMSKHVFDEVLKQIIKENYSPFEIRYWKPDVKNFMETYRKNFNKIKFERIIARPRYFGLFKFFPEMFTSGLIVRGGGYDTTNDIQVSVILTNYNPSWEKLKRSLCSALLQKNINIELIVADDGSDENYFTEIEELFAEFKFDRYVLFASSRNKGTVYNYYRALVNARGKYIRGLSPGDYLYDENTLAGLYDYAENHSADICFGNAIYYSDDDNGFKSYCVRTQPRSIRFYDDAYANSKSRKYAVTLTYSILNDFICGASFFYKPELIVQYITRILGSVKYAEDNSFRLMVLAGVDIQHYDTDIIWYEYGTGISTQKSEKWSALLKKDLLAANKIMLQCARLSIWFPARYKFLLRLGQKKMLCYILFPKAFYFKYYNTVYPSYTKPSEKTDFFRKLESC